MAEIARVLEVPAPVVSRRLHRARRRFANLLAAARRAEGGTAEPGHVLPEPTP